LSWLWHNKPIRAFAIGAAVLNVGIVAGESILVLFAQDELGLTEAGFGALIAATAVGYTVGSAMASRLAKITSRYLVVLLSVVAIAACSALIGSVDNWSLVAIGLGVIGIATGFWDVIAVSYRQAAVPDRLLGRIMAAYRFVAYGAFPLGATLGGVIARIGGNRAPFLAGALVVGALIPYLMVALRSVELDPARVDS
jgi:MFS family permease